MKSIQHFNRYIFIKSGIYIEVESGMKPTTFYVLMDLKTSAGFESFGKFFIGNNRSFAYDLFKKLKGNSHVDENAILTIELIETYNELPLNLKMISCSLKELGDNCRIITKELFKAVNLEEL